MTTTELARPIVHEITLQEVSASGMGETSAFDRTVSRTGSPFRRPWALFVGLVVAPVAIASVYFGLIASNIYVSEARFIVRSATHSDLTGLAVRTVSKSAAFLDPYIAASVRRLDAVVHWIGYR